MSPPDTDLEKQKRQHWAPLWGMALAVIFAFGLYFVWVTYLSEEGNEPEGAAVQVDTLTGETTGTPEPATVKPAESMPADADSSDQPAGQTPVETPSTDQPATPEGSPAGQPATQEQSTTAQ